MKKSIFVILLLLFAAPIVSAASATPAEPVTFQDGDCIFNLYGYEITNPIQNAIVFGVGKILDTYKNSFGFPYPDDFLVNVTIIAEKKDFLAYQRKHIGKVISQTGYYSGSKNETVVWQNTDTKEMLGVLFHEASHMILGLQIPWSPMWLNEGLAEYFEGLNVIGEKKRVNLQENRHSWTRHWAEDGFPMEIDKYINLSHEQWQEFFKKEPNASYTIGYSLVYYMMSSARTQQVLKHLLWQTQMYGPHVDSLQTFNDNYPGGFGKFERDWRKWIPRARKSRALRALKDKKKEPDPKTTADKK